MTSAPTPTAECERKTVERKTVKPGEPTLADAPRVECVDGVWHVRSLEAVRQVLREGDATAQAGFNSESVRQARPNARQPVLFLDGPEHRAQRSAIARYFAPATVKKRYRGLMEAKADALIEEFRRRGRMDLPGVTLRYSVDVAAQVIGLTDSDSDGMARRLEAFFAMPPVAPAPEASRFDRLAAGLKALRAMPTMMRFNQFDVKPAIAARRAEPQADVISHLIAQGYSDEEILIECVTYGAAGMVTTREFISMAVWHLLGRPELRARYLEAGEKERAAILDEILRLEPVVGHLFRRTTRPLTIADGDATYDLPTGALLDLSIRSANADELAVGERPLALCPGRAMSGGARPEGMGFGDGHHTCPGNSLATQETDVFLERLLPLPVRLLSEPRLEWDDLISGYAVRDVVLALGKG